jgi:hypothetical protein
MASARDLEKIIEKFYANLVAFEGLSSSITPQRELTTIYLHSIIEKLNEELVLLINKLNETEEEGQNLYLKENE